VWQYGSWNALSLVKGCPLRFRIEVVPGHPLNGPSYGQGVLDPPIVCLLADMRLPHSTPLSICIHGYIVYRPTIGGQQRLSNATKQGNWMEAGAVPGWNRVFCETGITSRKWTAVAILTPKECNHRTSFQSCPRKGVTPMSWHVARRRHCPPAIRSGQVSMCHSRFV
jgi:hypothetical protein